MDIVERARRYVQRMDPSVSGSEGHNKAFAAACALVNGFDLDPASALTILEEEFNPRCSPPWSQRELTHKVSQAASHGANKGTGYLIGEASKSRNGNAVGTSMPSRPPSAVTERIKKRQEFDAGALKRMMARGFSLDFKWLAERSPMDPREVTPAGYLDAIFEPGEKTIVFTDFTSQGQFGHVAGSPGKSYVLGHRPGVKPVPGAALPKTAREGAWYLPSPLDGQWHPAGSVDPKTGNPKMSRRSGASVVAYRHLLLESDEAPESEWLNLLCQLPLPITALYTSGGRSIHALVKIDTESKSQFDAFRDRISPLLSKLGADPAAISGVRLTRLPGVFREGAKDKSGRYFKNETPQLQRLLYLNPSPQVVALRTLTKLRNISAEQ